MINIDQIRFVKSPKTINGVEVVQDVDEVVEKLENGQKVARFEWGDSMQPILQNGEYGIITPIADIDDVKVGDAVFCCVHGIFMTHMVSLISSSSASKKYFLISNSNMQHYGWTSKIYGIVKGTNILESPLSYAEYEEL
jgi:hypothetical protein